MWCRGFHSINAFIFHIHSILGSCGSAPYLMCSLHSTAVITWLLCFWVDNQQILIILAYQINEPNNHVYHHKSTYDYAAPPNPAALRHLWTPANIQNPWPPPPNRRCFFCENFFDEFIMPAHHKRQGGHKTNRSRHEKTDDGGGSVHDDGR